MNSPAWLQRLLRTLALMEDALLTALLAFMILLAFLQIALRNLADMTLSWGDPLLRVLVLWIALVGALAATRDGHHIHMDIVSRFLPDRFRAPLQRFTQLFSALVSGVIAWYSAQLVLMEYRDASIAFSGIPTWTLELILPLGFLLMALRFLANAFYPPTAGPRV